MAEIHAGMAKHGMAWLAIDQTAGKGQRGKIWQSEPGKNIAMSLSLQPNAFKITDQFYLSMLMALACQDFINGIESLKAKIKWPNDIYCNDRKAGGILIETIVSGSNPVTWKWAVTGIGININQTDFDMDLSNPVSLKQLTGNNYDVLSLANMLYDLVLKRFDEMSAKNKEEILTEYNQQLYGCNEKVRLKKGNIIFETTIKGVNPFGQLITEDTMQRLFNFGEVEWIL
jgi:BirA family biotin operon repressor/biotin-[acetyl-CoA-carboxylase] ligase